MLFSHLWYEVYVWRCRRPINVMIFFSPFSVCGTKSLHPLFCIDNAHKLSWIEQHVIGEIYPVYMLSQYKLVPNLLYFLFFKFDRCGQCFSCLFCPFSLHQWFSPVQFECVLHSAIRTLLFVRKKQMQDFCVPVRRGSPFTIQVFFLH